MGLKDSLLRSFGAEIRRWGLGVLITLLVLRVLMELTPKPLHLMLDDGLPGLILLLASGLFFLRVQECDCAGPAFQALALALGARGLEVMGELMARLLHVPVPAPAWNLVRLILAGMLGWALLRWPREDRRAFIHGREILDAVLFATSLFYAVWRLGLDRVFLASASPLRDRALALAFFLVYDVLLGLALYRGLRSPSKCRGPLVWIVVALCIALVGNLAWMNLSLLGRYVSGGSLDLLTSLIPAAYVLAALTPFHLGPPRSPHLSILLPYAPFVVAFPVGVYGLLNRGGSGVEPIGLWLGVASLMLLGLRQLIAMLDLGALSRSLERQVAERTKALEESQSIILANQRMNFMATLGAGMAHDLNNLLNVVVLITSKLDREREEGLPVEADDLEAMRGVSLKASSILKKLMALGRNREPHVEQFALGDYLRQHRGMLDRLASGTHVLMEIGEGSLQVEVDPLHLDQILVNLVSNARDAMASTQGDVQVRCRLDQDMVLLEVEDTGTGISREHLARIFDPFFTTKEPGKGTGLGLASVKALVEECHGTLTVRSMLGQGTTFSIHLPWVR